MFSVNEFLDRAKRGAGVESDYALAKAVGVGRANVSNWRNDRTAPDGRAIMKLCELSGDDPEHVAACIQSMRAANDDEAELWQRVADRLRQTGSASISFLLAAAMLFGAGFAEPVQAAPALFADAGLALRIMSTSVRRSVSHAHHPRQPQVQASPAHGRVAEHVGAARRVVGHRVDEANVRTCCWGRSRPLAPKPWRWPSGPASAPSGCSTSCAGPRPD